MVSSPTSWLLLPIQRLPALAADPRSPRLAAGHDIHMVRDAHRLVTSRANDHHVRYLDRALALGDAALDLLLRIRTRVTLDHHHVLHQQLSGLTIDREHPAFLDLVFLLDIDSYRFGRLPFCDCHQITSGASETIFINFLSRSSLATGPNTRV